MNLIMIRYGEIALKGKNRTYFCRKLRRNIRECLKANGLDGTVWQEGQRIYVQTDQIEQALSAIGRVFGIVSLSPVHTVATDLGSIAESALDTAQSLGLNAKQSFRIQARRSDKSFPHISPEIERHVGALVADTTGAPVDLSRNAQAEIGIEVHADRVLVWGETTSGPGGLPLGTQGRVVALLSTGIDSPVAAWMLMKRGCGVIPVHYSIDPAQTEQVQSIVDVLNHYGYGWSLRPIILSHRRVLEPTLERLYALGQDRWACLLCKRTMLSKAAEIAQEMDAAAIVTGDSLGQVASQTLANLEVVSYGIQKPILRPLIGMDKVEITAIAKEIGTYSASISSSHACPFLPDRPLTKASIDKLKALFDQMAEAEQDGALGESLGTG